MQTVLLCRFMATEAIENNTEDTMMYYGTSFIQEADFPVNFYLKNMESVSGNDISESIALWMKNMPQGKWPNWMVSFWFGGLLKFLVCSIIFYVFLTKQL